MKDLNKKAFGGLLSLFIVLASALFISAGTLSFWSAGWRQGPAAEKEMGQKIIQSLASVAFVALFVVSALDHRYGWSVVLTYVVLAGDALIPLELVPFVW